ncbi:MAG: hypothetical protein KAR05_04835, partial [Candidatus Omnitrophica bacterium]|nr:hypothetical protein [Candidatus Omnitrophota bacterium]
MRNSPPAPNMRQAVEVIITVINRIDSVAVIQCVPPAETVVSVPYFSSSSTCCPFLGTVPFA